MFWYANVFRGDISWPDAGRRRSMMLKEMLKERPSVAQRRATAIWEIMRDCVSVVEPTDEINLIQRRATAIVEANGWLDKDYAHAIRDNYLANYPEVTTPWYFSLWEECYLETVSCLEAGKQAVNSSTGVVVCAGNHNQATLNTGRGSSIVNNIAIAALELQGGGLRPAVLDLDRLEAQGTFDVFQGMGIPLIDIHVGIGNAFPNSYSAKDTYPGYLAQIEQSLIGLDADLLFVNAGLGIQSNYRVRGASSISERDGVIRAWSAQSGIPIVYVTGDGYGDGEWRNSAKSQGESLSNEYCRKKGIEGQNKIPKRSKTR